MHMPTLLLGHLLIKSLVTEIHSRHRDGARFGLNKRFRRRQSACHLEYVNLSDAHDLKIDAMSSVQEVLRDPRHPQHHYVDLVLSDKGFPFLLNSTY
jgi:hypothetical protein